MIARWVVVGLVVVVAGCSPAESGGSEATRSEAAARPVPVVPSAGDVQPFVDRACGLLSAEVAVGFGLSVPGEQSSAPDRGLCVWQGEVRVGLQVRPGGDPLGDSYRRSGTWQVFTPLTVGGQPAVLTGTAEPGSGCHLVIGTAPGQGLDVDLAGREVGVDWCRRLVGIGEAMVAEVRDQAGG